MELSRKYFAQSLKLNPNNMRSLFGFYLVSDWSIKLPVLLPSHHPTECFNVLWHTFTMQMKLILNNLNYERKYSDRLIAFYCNTKFD